MAPPAAQHTMLVRCLIGEIGGSMTTSMVAAPMRLP